MLFWPIPAMMQPMFRGISDRLAALSLVDHDLPLGICQLPDHTRFADRLVLVDQCSPSNLQHLPFAEEDQCVTALTQSSSRTSNSATAASSPGRASADLILVEIVLPRCETPETSRANQCLRH